MMGGGRSSIESVSELQLAGVSRASEVYLCGTSDDGGTKGRTPRFKRLKKRLSGCSNSQRQEEPANEIEEAVKTAPICTLDPPTNPTNLNEDEENRSPGRNLFRVSPRRQVSFKLSRSPLASRRKQLEQTQSLDFPSRESHDSLPHESQPVMTWFKQADPPVNKSSGMGANGSTHNGRLKSRSQSSSALYCIKSGNANNNFQGGGRDPHHPAVYTNGGMLSNSIPADLWDLPPTTKSYSPITRKHSRPHLEHQKSAEFPSQDVTAKNQRNQKHRAFPFVDAFIHRSSGKRDAKKGKGRSGGSEREKFYAVSCPDVAQEANSSIGASTFCHSHGNANNPDGGYSYERSATAYEYDEGNPPNNFQPLINSSSSAFPYPPGHYQPNIHNYDRHPQYYSEVECGGGRAPIMFPFITEADIFEIRLIRDHRGLGLSVTGGSDSQENYPGLIRIKKVFPMGPAYQSGRLRPWDIILKANGVPLTGLTNHEALEVLRTTPVETILTVCRPPSFIPGFHILEQSNNSQSQPQLCQFHSSSYHDHQFEDQQELHHQQSLEQERSHQPENHPEQYQHDGYSSSSAFNPSVKSKSLSSLKIPSYQQQSQAHHSYGEFEVTLEKINGSLGFTLRQEDTSILGHYVRALVKDPALSDGRVQPGDRILSVNGQDLSGVSHADAIAFLRQCPAKVTLRLYRDVAPTPISPLSPTESHKSIKTKPLRQEAIDMLNDLALRKKMSGSDPKSSLPGSAVGRTGLRGKVVHDANGPATLPRRRHGLGGAVTPSPEVLSAALNRFAGHSTPKSNKSGSPESVKSSNIGPRNYPAETRSSGSGESTPAGTITQSRIKTDRSAYNNLYSSSSITSSKQQKDSVSSDSSMELGPRNRKPSFRQYTLHLDRISSLEDESFSSDLNHTDSIMSEPGFGMSPVHTGNNFRHGQPAYQSAILPSTGAKMARKANKRHKEEGDARSGRESPTTMSDIDAPSSNIFPSLDSSNDTQQMTSQVNQLSGTKGASSIASGTGKASGSKSGGLLKWKGVVFSQENDGEDENTVDDENDDLDSTATSTLSLRDAPGASNLSSSNSDHMKQLWKRLSDDEDEDDDLEDEDDGTESSGRNLKTLPQRRSPDGREFRDCDMMEVTSSTTQCNGEQIFTVQLSRRWCSRLGFSLQGSEGHTFISAIYPDSVAAKDGRLRVGDEIIMVNGDTIRDVSTSQVIDLMRKTRGIINITILRKPRSPGPDTNSSDHQLGLT
ncbi:unnamed protein product [Allacma fusca]|uniref:PDZ domain-containing protein n=1 Tax=Allacma fusca TaxID=39272 RepID=A0A8J2JWI7_9HEXA|nr:unnamed protein product [Allacma fusca]